MKIVQAPHEVLSQIAKPVGKVDKLIHNLLKDMEKTLGDAHDPEGIGLAAPQIGKSLQIFADGKEKNKGVKLEGCLSIYNVWGVVKRHYGVVLSYQDETGTKHKKKFDGFLATIIQHEFDHLQGILFPKRVLEQKNPLYHSIKNKKGEIEFEEIKI